MTPSEQITKQLNDEYDVFLNTEYEGQIAVPSFIIDLFKKAILSMPPFAHKINFYRIKAIAGVKPEELTNGLLQDIIKVVLNTSLERLNSEYSNALLIGLAKEKDEVFSRIIDKQIELEKFVLSYNNHMADFKKKLDIRKATLESLAGTRGNGLRIIPQA